LSALTVSLSAAFCTCVGGGDDTSGSSSLVSRAIFSEVVSLVLRVPSALTVSTTVVFVPSGFSVIVVTMLFPAASKTVTILGSTILSCFLIGAISASNEETI
jgi:hypothetical protein